MKRFKLLASVLFSVLIFSCGKDKNDKPSDTAAVITFNAPAANSRYANTSTLQIRGSIDDADILKNVKLEIRNKTSGTVLYTQTSVTGNVPLYNFNWNWTVSGITSIFTATVKVTSTDQYDYTTSKEVDIILEP